MQSICEVICTFLLVVCTEPDPYRRQCRGSGLCPLRSLYRSGQKRKGQLYCSSSDGEEEGEYRVIVLRAKGMKDR